MVFFTMKKYSHTHVTCASPIIFYPIPDVQRAEGICTQCNTGRSCTMVLSHWPATVHDAHTHLNGSFPPCRCLSLVINVFVATERHICPPSAQDFLAGGFLHSCFRYHCACALFLVNHLLLRVFVARTNFSPTMTCPERSGVVVRHRMQKCRQSVPARRASWSKMLHAGSKPNPTQNKRACTMERNVEH